jgi:hypothetical protein
MSLSNNVKNNATFRKGDLVTFNNGERGKLLFEISRGYWAVKTSGKDVNLDEKEMAKVGK